MTMTTAETAQMSRTDQTAQEAAEAPRIAVPYEQPEGDVIDLTILAKATWLMLKIVLPLLVVAFVVTIMFATVKQAIVASLVAFVLMIFIAIPLFLACLEDEIVEPETPEVHPESQAAEDFEPELMRVDAGAAEELKQDTAQKRESQKKD